MSELTLKHLLPWMLLPNDQQSEIYTGVLGHLLFITIEYAVYFMVVLATAYYIWMFSVAWEKRKMEKAVRELGSEKLTADISFLRAQLSPHFIFNSLNFIYDTVEPYSKTADAILKLSELMQYTIREPEDGCIGLEEEVQYIRNYIELIRLRYEPEYYVEFDVIGEVKNVKIPAMILIPFVENAMKHGVVHNPDYPVMIMLRIKGPIFTFTTINLKSKKPIKQDSGVGIKNVEKRLKLLYPGRDALQIEDSSNMFKVVLTISIKTNK